VRQGVQAGPLTDVATKQTDSSTSAASAAPERDALVVRALRGLRRIARFVYDLLTETP